MKQSKSTDLFIYTEKIIIIALVVFAVIGTAGALLLNQPNLALLGTYLCIPMLSAAIIWIRIRSLRNSSLNKKSAGFHELPILLFLIFFLFSIVILNILSIRTIPYYLSITVMGTLILVQILNNASPDRKQIVLILLQIIMLFLNIIWGVTLKYYFFIGRTDILFHSWAIHNLLSEGYINQTFDVYKAFPLWHILCTVLYRIAGLTLIPAKIMFITNGLIYGFLVLVIFLIAAKLFNIKIALLSALLLCFNTEAIFYGMYSIPRSVVFFLEGLLFLFLMRQKTFSVISVCIVIIAGLIMYHTASMPFIILILTFFYVTQKLYHVDFSEYLVNIEFLLLIFISTVSYWMYVGVDVFNSIAGSLLGRAPTGILTKSIVETPLNELFNYLQYSPLLLFIILGVLWGLKKNKIKKITKIFLIISLLLAPVSFPGPALLLNKLAGNFNLSRFGEYSFLFFSIAGASGIYVLFNKIRVKAVVIVIFAVMSLLAVSNDFTASDNPLIKRPFYTFSISEEECISAERVAQIADGYVMTDYISCRYLQHSEYTDKVHVLEVNKLQEFLIRDPGDILLLRNSELEKRPLKLFTSQDGIFLFKPSIVDSAMDYYYKDMPLWDTLENYNIVYDSGTVKGFKCPGVLNGELS